MLEGSSSCDPQKGLADAALLTGLDMLNRTQGHRGPVVVWGDANHGGDSRWVQHPAENILQVYATGAVLGGIRPLPVVGAIGGRSVWSELVSSDSAGLIVKEGLAWRLWGGFQVG